MDEESDESISNNTKCKSKPTNFRGNNNNYKSNNNNNNFNGFYHYTSNRVGFGFVNQNQYFQNYPSPPPLLPLPPCLPLQIPFPQNQSFRARTNFQKPPLKLNNPTFAAPSDSVAQDFSSATDSKDPRRVIENKPASTREESLTVARRPDSGGVEGTVIFLLANHFLVKFDPSQRIFHYDVEISPSPSKEVARMIKHNILENHSVISSGFRPVFDGRRTIYSPVEFRGDRIELYVNLPMKQERPKMFRVNIRLVSKLDGKKLENFLKDDEGVECSPIPQEYLHALDVVLREAPAEKCLTSGRSFYSSSNGGAREIGGGVVALRGFFQSLRPTQQGLALNLDLSVTAFHESIGVIPYLEKRLDFLRDLSRRKTRVLKSDERREVEKALKNVRVFVCHRETVQRYRVYGLTEEVTEDLWFLDRDGSSLRLIEYFKDHYNYDVQFRNLPCLQTSRSRPCYLPMELCVICEGQKFLGKLSDDQTAKILKMGCQRPRERKAIIDGVMTGPVGPTSGNQEKDFNLRISREMTQLNGRVLQPPKLKLGDRGQVRHLVPSRYDRQWNLLDSHVSEGTRVERWALISFGGTPDQRSTVPKFINQLCQRCEQLGIFLSKNTVVRTQFEPMQVLNSATQLESKLEKIYRASKNDLQLLVCVMERKHRGYGDLKRIAETRIGVVSQCCLYPKIERLCSQFLANLALKINAKVGGCTVALYNSLPSQIPRLFRTNEPAIFLGADVTHPHLSDDSSPSVAAVVGSLNWPAANKYVSRMRSQTHREEIIEELETMVREILEEFRRDLLALPMRIVFFRDGVSETQFSRVLREELKSIRRACARFPGRYDPPITFAVVQKRHHTRLFPRINENEIESNQNIPPGTVVDTVITHPREFDFYLCSHWGAKGTSRPIHYHVLVDENGFSSDELQRLVYNLCFTFVRCTKPISLVPPVYYAHLAAYRGRLYLERSDSRPSSTISRAAPPQTVPLPKLRDSVRKLMFYC